jgi:AcrR family transcriptional regulator
MVATILQATARVLVREGYEGANTNRIASAAGISVGSLYQYFPNKEALVAALIERHSEEMWSIFSHKFEVFAEAPLAVCARELIERDIAAHRVDPKLNRVLMEQVPRVGKLELVNEVARRVTGLVRAYLERHRAELRPGLVDLDVASFIVVKMVEAIGRAAVLERPELLEGDRLVDETTNAVVRYLT